MAIVINGSGTVTGLSVGGLPDGTVDSDTLASGIDKTSISDSGDATAITINSSENVGIGVVPEVTHSSHDALQVGGNGVWTSYGTQGASGEMDFQHNAYYSTSGDDKYISTDEATKYRQGGGTHQFKVASSGTANTAISWTTMQHIDASNIKFGATSGTWHSTSGVRFLGVNTDYAYNEFCRTSTTDNSAVIYIAQNTGGQSASSTNTNTIVFQRSDTNSTVGKITTSGSATAYNTSSDYRLKENVDYTWDATTRLKQLKPARFNWIADDTNTLIDGFIAHEVSSVVPEAVSGEKDAMTAEVLYKEGDDIPEGKKVGDVKTAAAIDPQGIDQSKLVPLLVKTIQELEARITALEA